MPALILTSCSPVPLAHYAGLPDAPERDLVASLIATHHAKVRLSFLKSILRVAARASAQNTTAPNP